jgi:hypothetical protein
MKKMTLLAMIHSRSEEQSATEKPAWSDPFRYLFRPFMVL